MPNSVKYNTESEANALRVGNMHIGTGDVPKGPTSTTGFYAGVNPPNGGYTIYLNKATQGPTICTPFSDAELILMTNGIADTSYTTINECFTYFAGQNDKMVMHNPINFMVTDGLILSLNSNILPSYPHNGTTWYDLSGNGNNTGIDSAEYNNGGEYFQSVGDTPDSLIFTTPDSTTISDTFSVTSGGWTIEELIRIDDTTYPESAAGTVVSNMAYGSDQTGFDWNHGVMSGTSLNIDMSNKDTGGGASRDVELNLAIDSDLQTYGQWILRSIYWDRTNDKCGVYYNGRFQDSGSISGISGYPLYDGGGIVWGTLYGWQHDGARSLMRVYNKILSESEVLQNYYQAPIVTDGLVLAVDAGNLVSYESGSTTTHSLTGSNSGTLDNGVGFTNDNGGSWEFDGVNNRINLGQNVLSLENASFSLEAWVKWDGGSQDTFFGYHQTKSAQKSIHWRIYPDGTLRFDFYSNAINSSAGAIVADTWYNLLVTYDYSSDTCKCYKNGTLLMQGSVGPYLGSDSSSTATIGCWIFNQYFGGKIPTFRAYSRALTSDEVSQNYNANINRFN